MFPVKGFFAALFGSGSHLSNLEKIVLGCVREHLDAPLVKLWDMQIQAINKAQRLPKGVEVNYYRIKRGRPSFDAELRFPNIEPELLVAKVRLELANMGKLVANVWCVNGFLFSIDYEGSVSYFEEAAGMDPRPAFKLSCELIANLDSG